MDGMDNLKSEAMSTIDEYNCTGSIHYKKLSLTNHNTLP
jgi:hypothetical protein